ncbi:FAD-binding oxidoreductase [Ectothiorhodospira sp. 9100]|nr:MULTISPECIES: FAD-binding oxidoreductase [unclassified Ectothiorhodospira]MCG5517213.1 FAD-binding oxidoreductase [Ectothiorhodospira sp. 9100]MCG5520131.1 FAD-binding oxidoreductase [Ectothiorhodospira sp. 9905]
MTAPGNVTGVHHTPVKAISPTTVPEIQSLIRRARQDKIPLYPISKGHNWGYGSDSPVTEGNILVDLSGMNRILNAEAISLANPIAVIEPGVTQGQLHAFLAEHYPDLTFNVTGAGCETSLIGCALDRGVGYFGPRREDLFGLEIVTGTGEILKTGFRRLGEDSPLAHLHPEGLGPSLDGLFFQGNFGIVTSACMRLRPRRPREVAVSLSLHHSENLGELVNQLAQLKRDGLLTSVTHVGNRARNHSTLTYGIAHYLENSCAFSPAQSLVESERVLNLVAPSEWTSLAAVTGNRGQVSSALREIRRRVGSLARVLVITDRLLDLGFAVSHALRFIPSARAVAAAIHAMRPLHRLALGTPTDIPIQNLLWKVGHPSLDVDQLDYSSCGVLFVSPALPLNGAFVTEVIAGMERIAKDYGHCLYVTLNIETATSLVAVINLLFDRDDNAKVEIAHRCADALLAFLQERGLSPYRARVDMMEKIVSPHDPHWQTVRKLKDVFDPDNIIAPGRYNLP